MKRLVALTLASLFVLSACDSNKLPDWMGGAKREIKRTPGERIDVVFSPSHITPDSAVADVAVEIPEQTNATSWHSLNSAMQIGHIGLTGLTHVEHATVGDGNSFSRVRGPEPIVAGGLVFAMDAAGNVSAHDESDIDTIKWISRDALADEVPDALGGGMAYTDGTLFASTGTGSLRAINVADGKTKWQIKVGAPVRGAPAAGNGIVAVLTADNQTIAFDPVGGGVRWTHRGIREAAGYFSTTAPVIQDGIVISAYSSGELFALRAETGNVIWNDTLGTTIKTRAAAIFSGIDAEPMVQNGAVVVLSASGEMQASALENGRPLWQQRIGGHTTPWSAGNALFVLSDTHDLAAIFKRDGQVRWATSLAIADKRDSTRDITPALYGPILAGNAVLVLDANGILTAFKPQDGKTLGTYELAENPVSTPLVANGALYYITRDAQLYRYH